MTKSAVVDLSTGAIVNLIVADPSTDASPSHGTRLIAIPDGMAVGRSWTWSKPRGFVAPLSVSADDVTLAPDVAT